jgi:acetylornithine deacetylase
LSEVTPAAPIALNEARDLLAELVAIDSVNPWLVPGGAGEAEAAQRIAAWLRPLDVDVSLDEVEPRRPNVVARWRGSGGGRSLCLNAHTDTVGYGAWPQQALQARVEGDRLIGLGSSDDKGQCVAALLALKSLVLSGQPLNGDLIVACVVDEEGATIGTSDLVRRHAMDAAIVLESNPPERVLVAHQGFGWIDLVVHGQPAHGSAPDVGVDAIVHMAEVVRRLHQLDANTFVPHPHPLNGRTVFHTGTIAGGTDYATYPDRCVLGIEIGTQPGETLADRVREIEAIFAEVAQLHPGFRGEVEVKIDRNPFEARDHEQLWEALDSALQATLGRPAEPAGDNAWMDAALMQEAGIPTLVCGAVGGGFHAPDEWVSLSDIVRLARTLEETARRFCA